MVDPISGKASARATGDRSLTPLAPVAKAPAQPAASAPVEAGSLARDLASAPPVDAERVARIKKAVEDGRFPILPATVADRLLAFKLEWNPDDAG